METTIGKVDIFDHHLDHNIDPHNCHHHHPHQIVMISYGGAAAVPDRSIVSELTGVYLDSLYYLGPAGPVSKEKAPGS